MTEEIWKMVPGAGGRYRVSNLGYIQSTLLSTSWKTLQPGTGPMRVMMEDGERRQVMLHRLIAEAFLPRPPAYPRGCKYVLHRDKNHTNNKVSNLAWSSSPRGKLNDPKQAEVTVATTATTENLICGVNANTLTLRQGSRHSGQKKIIDLRRLTTAEHKILAILVGHNALTENTSCSVDRLRDLGANIRAALTPQGKERLPWVKTVIYANRSPAYYYWLNFQAEVFPVKAKKVEGVQENTMAHTNDKPASGSTLLPPGKTLDETSNIFKTKLEASMVAKMLIANCHSRETGVSARTLGSWVQCNAGKRLAEYSKYAAWLCSGKATHNKSGVSYWINTSVLPWKDVDPKHKDYVERYSLPVKAPLSLIDRVIRILALREAFTRSTQSYLHATDPLLLDTAFRKFRLDLAPERYPWIHLRSAGQGKTKYWLNQEKLPAQYSTSRESQPAAPLQEKDAVTTAPSDRVERSYTSTGGEETEIMTKKVNTHETCLILQVLAHYATSEKDFWEESPAGTLSRYASLPPALETAFDAALARKLLESNDAKDGPALVLTEAGLEWVTNIEIPAIPVKEEKKTTWAKYSRKK